MKKVDHIKLNVDKDKPEKGAIVVFADGTTQNVNTEFVLREKEANWLRPTTQLA